MWQCYNCKKEFGNFTNCPKELVQVIIVNSLGQNTTHMSCIDCIQFTTGKTLDELKNNKESDVKWERVLEVHGPTQ